VSEPGGRRRGRPGHDLASVLAVAVELFNERGYDGTSMRDLADRLGIAKSAIYHHVAGKEELLSLALDRALGGLAALDQRRAFDRFVAELVADAVRDGDIRSDADAMITARLLFGLVNSIVEWYRPDRRANAAPLADAVCALAFDGLRARRPGAARQ
jgi:AcrR family transcriptional regulator